MPTREPDQTLKASLFQSLHQRPQAFRLPNPWDAGTTRLLTSLGFEAVATTSLGLANMLGRKRARRGDVLENCRAICRDTSAGQRHLENCYADEPNEAASMIRMAYEYGAWRGRRVH
jgi:2-methylisocitrate lyase-like PEP mutase family enzyme